MRSHRYPIDKITLVEEPQLAVDDPTNSTSEMSIDRSSSSRDQANIIFSAPAIELHLSVRMFPSQPPPHSWISLGPHRSLLYDIKSSFISQIPPLNLSLHIQRSTMHTRNNISKTPMKRAAISRAKSQPKVKPFSMTAVKELFKNIDPARNQETAAKHIADSDTSQLSFNNLRQHFTLSGARSI